MATQPEETPFYKRTYNLFGYDIPYWVPILILIVLVALYLYSRNNPGGLQILKFNNSADVAPASAVETPTVIKNIVG